VAWLLPELELGVEPELKPLDPLEFELEPVEVEPVELELEPVEVEPVFVEPVEVEPVLVEPVDELVEEPDDEEDAVVCVEPGRTRATTPAAATLAMVTVVVVDRIRARPRSRSAMAWRTRSRYALLMCSILRSGNGSLLHKTSRLAMKPAACPRRLGVEATQRT
jgi:hypothetical protein